MKYTNLFLVLLLALTLGLAGCDSDDGGSSGTTDTGNTTADTGGGDVSVDDTTTPDDTAGQDMGPLLTEDDFEWILGNWKCVGKQALPCDDIGDGGIIDVYAVGPYEPGKGLPINGIYPCDMNMYLDLVDGEYTYYGEIFGGSSTCHDATFDESEGTLRFTAGSFIWDFRKVE
jgi:hypothetical protein